MSLPCSISSTFFVMLTIRHILHVVITFVDGRAEKPVESTNEYEGNGKSFACSILAKCVVELYDTLAL